MLLIQRLRPHPGWPVALLALGAASTPGMAAHEAALPVPAGLIFWAGLLGAALGMRLARPLGPIWRTLSLSAIAALGAVLVLAGGSALPPPGLIARDLGAALGSLGAGQAEELAGAPPGLLTGRFLALALPRLWRTLQAAPGAGEAGAALIVTTAALLTTWVGALVLGWAGGALRPNLAWGLPLLFALALTTILSGGGGAGIVLGVALLLALTVVVGHTARERAWDAKAYAYPDLLGPVALTWGLAATAAVALGALAIPTALPDLGARLPGAKVELPSGLAAIEGHVRRGRPTPVVDPGLSRLPAITLGVSLERSPPGAVSLRVRVGAPLAPGPWPRYWRARVLDRYSGAAWSTAARRDPAGDLQATAPPPGAIVQEVEDLRPDPAVLVALPDVVGIDRPVAIERLPDGSLAALGVEGRAGRYTVVSLPQELAPADSPPAERPYQGESLSVPASVPQRVVELARTIAGGAGTPMEQALALEGYLRGLPYAYEVRPLPRGGDAVDQFLFEMRHGYCTYYASSMAIMARSLGIPARLAVGYATGAYDPASGAYIVRESDAHAWPELLIGGRWLSFEPTPLRPQPERGPSDTSPPPTVTAANAREAPTRSIWSPWAVAGLAGVLGCVAALILWRRTRVTPIVRAQLQLERLGARAGVPWPSGATMQEYGRILATARPGPCGALAELIGLVEGARYGRRPLGPAQERQLRRATHELRRWLRPRR